MVMGLGRQAESREYFRKGIQVVLSYLATRGRLNKQPGRGGARAEKSLGQLSIVLLPQVSARHKVPRASYLTDWVWPGFTTTTQWLPRRSFPKAASQTSVLGWSASQGECWVLRKGRGWSTNQAVSSALSGGMEDSSKRVLHKAMPRTTQATQDLERPLK